MRNYLIVAGAVLAFGLATPALALGPNGGNSKTHLSTQGALNTNGPNAADRDTGLARAQTRMSANGLKHSKARLHAKSTLDTDKDKDEEGK